MNRNQKVILIVGLFLILLSGLFPAYEGVWKYNYGSDVKFEKYLGYYFIFKAPEPYQIAREMEPYAKITKKFNLDINHQQWNTSVIVSRYFIQIITILLLTIGLMILFADPKFEKSRLKNQ